MSSVINNQYPCIPPLEGNQQDEPRLIPFFPSYETSSSFPYPISYSPSDKKTYCDQDRHHQEQEAVDGLPDGGSRDSLLLRISMPGSNDESEGNSKMSTRKLACERPPKEKTSRWMSSKMRLMRKMMSSHAHEQVQQTSGDSCNSSSSNGSVRVCSDCKTTKTPLWRSGPQGPKSLCNACGIRQRKARKAMAAAAMKRDPGGEEKESDSSNAVVPYKKRNKPEDTNKKVNLEDYSISSKKSVALHPQDEKEAAILLMALSCDLIYG